MTSVAPPTLASAKSAQSFEYAVQVATHSHLGVFSGQFHISQLPKDSL
jgi:hypothetical protein